MPGLAAASTMADAQAVPVAVVLPPVPLPAVVVLPALAVVPASVCVEPAALWPLPPEPALPSSSLSLSVRHAPTEPTSPTNAALSAHCFETRVNEFDMMPPCFLLSIGLGHSLVNS